MNLKCLAIAAVCVLTCAPLAKADGHVTAFRVGKVVTMDGDDRIINNATVLVEDGRITAVGKSKRVEIPEGATVVEHPTLWLTPGIVELHNHVLGSLADLNDGVYLTNPGLRTLETVTPNNSNVTRARAAGVTAGLLIPGSGNNMSGFGTVAKFAGDTVDEAVMRSPGSLKIAQAGNPESYWFGVQRSFQNYNLRRTLQKAKDYYDGWKAHEEGEADNPPDYDPTFHGFIGLFDEVFPASVHTQAYQLVMTTVSMLAQEFGIRVVLDHSTFDSWKVAPLVKEVGTDRVMTIVGPRAFQMDTYHRRLMGNVASWAGSGIEELGINTDSPVIPQEELPVQAAIACWYGFNPYDALAGITRVGAKALHIEDRVGSIEVGKDADFGLWTGNPVDPRSSCLMTVIDGKIVYDAAKAEKREF
ncbi:MAG: amidohydrolase family protein [Planctomycetota bacterium]